MIDPTMMTRLLLLKGVDYVAGPQLAAAKVAAESYARAQGLGAEFELITLETGRPLAWFEEDELFLDPVLEQMGRGRALVVSRLNTLSADPQIAVAALTKLIAKGARPFVMELGSNSAAAHLDVLTRMATMLGSYQKRVEAAERDAAFARDEAYAEALADFQAKLSTLAASGKIMVNLPDAPEPENNPEAGEQLRAYRRERGMSQMQLAERLGTDQPAISRLERTGRPLKMLEDALKVVLGDAEPVSD